LRELLAEFGIALAQSLRALERGVPEIPADAENGLSDRLRERFSLLFNQLRALSIVSDGGVTLGLVRGRVVTPLNQIEATS
jgi:hypothetical protein